MIDMKIDPVTAAREINEKAQQELAWLRAEIAKSEQAIEAAQSERSRLTEQRGQLLHSLATEQAQHNQAQEKQRQATSYARIAAGTVGADRATLETTEAERACKVARRNHEAAQRLVEETAPGIDARLTELDQQESIAYDVIQRARAWMSEVETVQQRSLAELGDSLFRAFEKEHTAQHVEPTEVLHEKLAALRIQETTFAIEASKQLAQWPDLASRARSWGAQDEGPLLRVLRLELAYIDQLIADTPVLEHLPNMKNRYPVTQNYYHWMQILGLEPSDVWEVLRRRNLQIQRERVSVLLAQVEAGQ
ncbi:MAG TPA: hypothetical protein VH593_16825 [Ktedonobacteraceae bacterium]|jgi:DNA repair exonuclease SbcCD ATPase subunit